MGKWKSRKKELMKIDWNLYWWEMWSKRRKVVMGLERKIVVVKVGDNEKLGWCCDVIRE